MPESLIEVEAAWDCIERVLQPLASEDVLLGSAVGRVLASAVHCDRDYPPFARAAMDGFAVRAVDVARASPGAAVQLQVIGESTPGIGFEGVARDGTAIRIMTGAAVPAGWDSVVPVEHTSGFGGETVQVTQASGAGDHIVPRGVERRAHESVYEPGHALTAADVGALAMLGMHRVHVHRLPALVILSTGNELVSHDRAVEALQIRDSNAPMLAALAAARASVRMLGHAVDTRQDLEAPIALGLQSDLMIVTGGVSKGAYDFVGEVLQSAGVHMHFAGVSLQPGKPVAFGTHAQGAVLALPGNPVSALTTFRLFGLPVLLRLQGARATRPVWTPFRARFSWVRRNPKCLVLPGRRDEDGVERVPYAGSGDLLAYARADCQIVLNRGIDRVEPGDMVPVWPL